MLKHGDLFLWIDQTVIEQWQEIPKTEKKGRPKLYADDTIKLMLTIKELYNLPLRTLVEWMESFFEELNIQLPVPHYATICRRQKTCPVHLKKSLAKSTLYFVISTDGLSIYNPKEWTVRSAELTRAKTYKKLRLCVDPDNGLISIQS